MPEPLEESLSFDISAALQGIGQLDDALQAVVATFQTGLGDALIALSSAGSDIPPLADTLDVAGLGTSIDATIADALDAPRPPLEIDANPVDVQIDGDTTQATQAIAALDSTPVTLEVDADTAGAQDSIDQLGQSATDAVGGSGTGGKGGEGLSGLEGAVLGIKAASGAASGSTGELTAGLGELGGASTAVAIGGGAAFAAFLGETTSLAADAQAQNKRFTETFGGLADAVKSIDVGGLNISLEDLGKQSGTTNADLEATASRIGLLGQSSGASNPTIVSTTQNLLALGATLSVNNPRLGDAASVTDRLTNAFARGGRALAPFGIALSSAQINAEALSETGKTTAADLTLFEKSTAGANLALATFGDTLGTKFASGAQNAQVQFRALKTQLEETLVAVGGPLLQPLVAGFTSLLPVAEATGKVLGGVAQIVLPFFKDLGPLLAPVAGGLSLVATGLGGIGDLLAPLDSTLGEVVIGIGALAIAARLAIPALIEFATAGDLALGPVGWVALGATALAGLGGAMDLLGGHAKSVVIDTSSLNDAFTAASSGATGLTTSVTSVNDAVDQFLKKNLALSAGGQTGVDVANELGASFGEIGGALTGTNAQFQQFIASIDDTSFAQDKNNKSFLQFQDTLETGRATLQNNAQATLAADVASGLLTKSQLAQAVATSTVKGEADDYGRAIVDNVAVLKTLGPLIDANTQATTSNALANAEGSQAFSSLVQQLSSGAISADTFANSLDQFGFSSGEATDFTKALNTELDTFAKSVAGKLPGVSDALSQYSNDVKSSLEAAGTAMKDHKGDAKALFAQFVTDSDPSKFTANVLQQAADVAGFGKNLAKVAAVAPELADKFAQLGPALAGGVTAGFASNPVKAKLAEGALQLADVATQNFENAASARHAAFESSGRDIGTAALAGLQSGFDPASAVKAPLNATALAIAENPGFIFSGHTLGTKTAAAFGTGADVAGAAKTQLSAGETAISQFDNINIAAGHLGQDAGLAFGEGMALGIGDRSSDVAAAAGALASTADAAVKRRLGIASPSTVGITLGQQFTQGIAIGITRDLPQAEAASAGFANGLITEMNQLLTAGMGAAGLSAGQALINGFVSSAIGALPSVGSIISSFTQTIVTDGQAQTAALQANHDAYKQYAKDQATIPHLLDEQHNATTRLHDAQVKLFTDSVTLNNAKAKLDADTAAKASKATIEADRAAVDLAKAAVNADTTGVNAAKQNLNTVNNNLASQRGQIKADQENIASTSKTLKDAQDVLAKASSPATFTKNLNETTAAGRRFQNDIAKLTKEGFTALADQLAAAGPTVAGKLADQFAASPAQARAANAAVKTAETFATTFSTGITSLLGGTSATGATATATNIGTTTGNALVSGFKTSLATGLGPTSIAKALHVGAPAVNQSAIPSLSIPSLNAPSGSQSLELDLTIVLQDGSTVNAQTSVVIPPRTGNSLKQRVAAEVKA